MAEFKKSDAIDYAHSVKLLVDSFISEGFDEDWAKDFVKSVMVAMSGKNTMMF